MLSEIRLGLRGLTTAPIAFKSLRRTECRSEVIAARIGLHHE
jgi:hypothetical protein